MAALHTLEYRRLDAAGGLRGGGLCLRFSDVPSLGSLGVLLAHTQPAGAAIVPELLRSRLIVHRAEQAQQAARYPR